jgi:hypothetical protein
MYIRSVRNIDRLIGEQRNRVEREEAMAKWAVEQEKFNGLQSRWRRWRRKTALLILPAVLAGSLGVYFFFAPLLSRPEDEPATVGHPLAQYFDQGFDADFDSPYLQESWASAADTPTLKGFDWKNRVIPATLLAALVNRAADRRLVLT